MVFQPIKTFWHRCMGALDDLGPNPFLYGCEPMAAKKLRPPEGEENDILIDPGLTGKDDDSADTQTLVAVLPNVEDYLRAEVAALSHQLETTSQRLDNEMAAHCQTVDALRNTSRGLQESSAGQASLEKELKALRDDADSPYNLSKRAKAQSEQHKIQCNARDHTSRDLRKKRDEIEVHYHRVEKRMKHYESQVESKLQSWKHRVWAAEDRAELQLGEEEGKLRLLEPQLQGKENRLRLLEPQLQDKEHQLRLVESQLREKEDQLRLAKAQLREKNKEFGSLKLSNGQLTKARDEANKSARNALEAEANMIEELDIAEQKIVSLEAELKTAGKGDKMGAREETNDGEDDEVEVDDGGDDDGDGEEKDEEDHEGEGKDEASDDDEEKDDNGDDDEGEAKDSDDDDDVDIGGDDYDAEESDNEPLFPPRGRQIRPLPARKFHPLPTKAPAPSAKSGEDDPKRENPFANLLPQEPPNDAPSAEKPVDAEMHSGEAEESDPMVKKLEAIQRRMEAKKVSAKAETTDTPTDGGKQVEEVEDSASKIAATIETLQRSIEAKKPARDHEPGLLGLYMRTSDWSLVVEEPAE